MGRDDRRARMRMRSEDVERSAQQGYAGSGQDLPMVIPSEYPVFKPNKAGAYLLRVCGYPVTKPGNPDKIAVGGWHYRRRFGVHFDVGGSGENVLCVHDTFGGKMDVIDAQVKELSRDYKGNEDAIKALRPSRFCAIPLLVIKTPDGVAFDPKNPQVSIYIDKYAKFAKQLDQRLQAGEAEDLEFAQPDGGKLLRVFMSEKNVPGMNAFLEPSSIEIADAKSLTDLPDAVLDLLEELKLDEFFVIPDPAHIAELFGGDGAAAEPESEFDEQPAASGKGKPGKPSTAEVADEWDTGGGEPEPEPEPPPARGKSGKGKKPEPEPEPEPEPPPARDKSGKGKKPEPEAEGGDPFAGW